MDFEAIGRVVDSVRSADIALGYTYLLPTSRNTAEWEKVRSARATLSNLISWAYTFRGLNSDWTSDSRAKRRFKALARVRSLSQELAALIEDEDLPLSQSLAPRFRSSDQNGFHVVDFAQLMTGLRRLREASEQERDFLRSAGLHDQAPRSHIREQSTSFATPGNAFISGLGKAFEKGFEQPPHIKFTSAREPTGPFVHFVEAVTLEMGESMSRDGIRKAWERRTQDK